MYPWKGQLLPENFPSDMISSLYCGTSAVSISKNHDIISQEKINRISSSEKKGLCYHFLKPVVELKFAWNAYEKKSWHGHKMA